MGFSFPLPLALLPHVSIEIISPSTCNDLILVAISGVYHIVNWEMDPWMALLWGVGQVSIRHDHINSLGFVSYVLF